MVCPKAHGMPKQYCVQKVKWNELCCRVYKNRKSRFLRSRWGTIQIQFIDKRVAEIDNFFEQVNYLEKVQQDCLFLCAHFAVFVVVVVVSF